MHQVVFEDEDDDMTDLAYDMDSDTASDWEHKIYTNVSAAFTVSPYDEQFSSLSSDVAFYNATNTRR